MPNSKVGEKHGDITIIALARGKEPNGYLYYYWVRCECGNVKRLRYDQARRAGNCGLCEDFKESRVIEALKER